MGGFGVKGRQKLTGTLTLNLNMEPLFFKTPAEFRAWLEDHHKTMAELLVGFHKTGSGKQSMTWPESVDQALCYGWIDGIRRSVGEESYSIRFTPRKSKSTWSAVNIRKIAELTEAGLMKPAGIAAFQKREESNSVIYSHENPNVMLDPAFEREFMKNKDAWAFFNAQAPSYRRIAIFLVMKGKAEATRKRNLVQLIDDSAKGLRLKQLRRD